MNSAHFNRLVQEAGFRPIDRHIARWLTQRCGNPLIGLAGLAASAAEGAGSACVDLQELAGLSIAVDSRFIWPEWEEWITGLSDDMWISASRPDAPLVLRDGVCWLQRNWQHEKRIAASIRKRLAYPERIDPSEFTADIDALFRTTSDHGGMNNLRTDWQRVAVASLPGKRFFVLTGGPGTGKTTTVLRMLLLLLRQYPQRRRIALAAPTGKAAQRLGESLRTGLLDLRKSLPGDWSATLDAMPEGEPLTLHRLLGYSGRLDSYTYDIQQKLPIDILVIDEASMVDLAMLRRVFDAAPDDSLIVLVGDPDQLASVEAGSVLADIVAAASDVRPASMPAGDSGAASAAGESISGNMDSDTVSLSRHSSNAKPSGEPDVSWSILGNLPSPNQPITEADHAAAKVDLRDCIVRLDRVWRASGRLLDLAAAVRDGDTPLARNLLAPDEIDSTVAFRDLPDARSLRIVLRQLVDPVSGSGVFDAMLSATSPQNMLQQLGTSRIVTALRHGDFGQLEINRNVETLLKRRFKLGEHTWYPGRAIIVTENDYERGLYNGDIGVACAEPGQPLRIWFESAGASPQAHATVVPAASASGDPTTVSASPSAAAQNGSIVRPPTAFSDGTLEDLSASSSRSKRLNTTSPTTTTRLRSFAPGNLPDHEPAFAMTVHKSQGSEFEQVIVILPPTASRAVTRDLLYTAITRARQQVALWASEVSLETSLQQRMRRAGRLKEALQEG